KNVSIYVLVLHQILLLLRLYFYLASHHSDVHLNAKFYKRESIIDESVSTINKLFQSLLLTMKYRQHLFLFLVLLIFPLTISLRANILLIHAFLSLQFFILIYSIETLFLIFLK